jgi:CBS-domain-containing membrane protein
MRPEPPVLPGWATIDQAIGSHALDGRPDAYCVQGEDGRITGLITAAQVAHTDRASRTSVPMANLAFPIDRVVCAITTDPALPTLRRLAGAAVPLVLVLWPNGRVAGTVGEPELRQALTRRTPLAASRG